MNKKEEIIRLNRVLEETLFKLRKTNYELNDTIERCKKLEIYVAKLNDATIRDENINNSYYLDKMREGSIYKGTPLIEQIIRQLQFVRELQGEISKLKSEQEESNNVYITMLLDHFGLEVTTIPAQPEKKVLTKIKKTK